MDLKELMSYEDNLDPKLVKKAKEMAAGPLGEQMAKFPLRFASAIYYGKKPTKGVDPIIENYRRWLQEDRGLIFQIGNLKIDPIPKIIYESVKHDLIALKIDEKEQKQIAIKGEIGKDVYYPQFWPPSVPTDKDWVCFGGFPGKWRQYPSSKEIIFDSFSSGCCKVGSVSDDKFICQFERDYWVKCFDIHQHEELHQLGGLSGAPVFLIKNINSITTFEFVGIVYEFSEMFDLMYVRLAKFIQL